MLNSGVARARQLRCFIGSPATPINNIMRGVFTEPWSRLTCAYLDTPPRCAVADRVAPSRRNREERCPRRPWPGTPGRKRGPPCDGGPEGLAWRGMLCVETGDVADGEVRLAAYDEH